ncbi:MAG TPA: hypothetical protein PLA11_08825 [Flavobacteriales bacterium]|nr:hypothetical protein [Flavobacteriales bacterium]
MRPSPTPLLTDDGRLTPMAVDLLAALAAVDRELLIRARVIRTGADVLWFPWYRRRRGGGAFVVGRTIRFTPNWYAASGYGRSSFGDRSRRSTLRWLMHLAHEVGHLPQAERFGQHALGRLRYLLAFAGQYGSRALLGRWPVHDGAPLEREADRGRWVLRELLVQDRRKGLLLVKAVQAGDRDAVLGWLRQSTPLIGQLQTRYDRELAMAR